MHAIQRRSTSPTRRRGSSRSTWLVGIVAAVLVIAAIGFLMLQGRARAHRTMCHGRLFEIAFFLRQYCESEGCLPPAILRDGPDGLPYSWRVVAYRHGDPGTYDAYDRSSTWDSEENKWVLLREHLDPACFACPADKAAQRNALTSYVAVVGKNTLWPGKEGRKIPELTPEIRETILLIEIPHSDIPWTEPRDLTLEEAVALYREEKELGPRRHPEGLNYITFGGQYGSLRSIDTVEEFIDMLCVPE